MKRRDLIALLGGTVLSCPWGARAKQPVPIIGFVRSTSRTVATHLLTAFQQGLKEAGFVEGENVAVEYQFAEGSSERLSAIVADFVGRPVAVIVGNSRAALAAKAATTTVPIVFAFGGDPVSRGLVASLNRPGGNVTGVVFFGGLVGSKRLDLLRQLVPKATTIAVLVGPDNSETAAERRDIEAASQAVGQQLVVLKATTDRDIEAAFETFIQRGAGALLVGAGSFTFANRQRLVTLAAQHSLPTCYSLRTDDGLMSYGASISDAYRQVGIYVARILKGEKPADLPVMRSTKFELVVNLKTAAALGLTVPSSILAGADEVIE
jgi:putative ABC transport system substrate-binding protein